MKKNYIIIRRTFPQVYSYVNSTNGMKYWIGSARSRRWGMDERRHFNSEKEAVDWARQIAKKIEEEGAQPEIAKDKLELAKAYQSLTESLSAYGKTPEEAVAHSAFRSGLKRCVVNMGSRSGRPPLGYVSDVENKKSSGQENSRAIRREKAFVTNL